MTARMPGMKNNGIIFIVVVVQVIPAATMLMAAAAHVRPSREFLVSGSRHGNPAERAGGHVTRESVADVGWHLLAAISSGHRHVTGPVTLVANCRLLLV